MELMKAHPNTQAVLAAWRRLADGETTDTTARIEDHPDLVGGLFVLVCDSEADYAFRRVGYAMERLFGRALPDHNFLSIWNNPDRQLVCGGLALAAADNGPVVIHARGESLDGRRIDLEFGLAPLPVAEGQPRRFLGVCQSLTPSEALAGRPLRRLRAVAVFPPAPASATPAIRLVSSR